MKYQKLIHDLNKKARAILINGRPFTKKTGMGEWMGFRWGKAEISIRTWSPILATDLWRSMFYSKGGSWDLDPGWDLEILRNLDAALDDKLKEQERRRQLTCTQKFYGNLTLKELAN